MNLIISAESIAGSVLGIQATPVNPPFAAALHPVITVSSSSLPGSRRCTCISKSPGTITFPEKSYVSESFNPDLLISPISLMMPSSSKTETFFSSIFCSG